MTRYVGALDQGTTSSRFMIFDDAGRIVSSAKKEHSQIFPQPGWVEHDPSEIWGNCVEVINGALTSADLGASDLAAVGITNQRETTVVWERQTGLPVANAVVWQDTRTADLCSRIAGDEGTDRFRDRTGLPLATYFSGPKLRWLIDNHDLGDRATRGELAFGTVDSWLAWNLTGGRAHITDVTNASRTMLMDLATVSWDADLALEIGVPTVGLPEIRPSLGIGEKCVSPLEGVPLTAILGDQQAALFGQACFEPGDVKNTYGTGNFILMNTGSEMALSDAGLLTTVAYQRSGSRPVYALEGSIAVTGSLIQWLRDNLELIGEAAEVEALAAGVEDNGDVYFVPAFSGLFAPYWRSDARGVIAGLTRFATKGHIARAALEATAYQTADVVDAMVSDSDVAITKLKVDGGMTANGLLMQFQSDILGIEVVRPAVTETTALGAALAAGLDAGIWSDLSDLGAIWRHDRTWSPQFNDEDRLRLRGRWAQAVEKSLDWA